MEPPTRSSKNRLRYQSDRFASGLQQLRQGLLSRRRVLFHPYLPVPRHSIWKILCHLGVSITPNLRSDVGLAVRWENETYATPTPMLSHIARRTQVLNLNCVNISKELVNAVFSEVFGYELGVDPLAYEGMCVEKPNSNAQKSGNVVRCPIPERRPGCAYQRLVDTSVSATEVRDLRVPVIGRSIPLAYLKWKPRDNRFAFSDTRAELVRREDVLDTEETFKIIEFCSTIGLDFGELDILRDADSGRIYIIDANSTPFGPPRVLGDREARHAVSLLASTFEFEFDENWQSRRHKA